MLMKIIFVELIKEHCCQSRLLFPEDMIINRLIPTSLHTDAIVTFPRYDWATKWNNYCIYIVMQKSEMAAANACFCIKNLNRHSDTAIMLTIMRARVIGDKDYESGSDY